MDPEWQRMVRRAAQLRASNLETVQVLVLDADLGREHSVQVGCQCKKVTGILHRMLALALKVIVSFPITTSDSPWLGAESG